MAISKSVQSVLRDINTSFYITPPSERSKNQYTLCMRTRGYSKDAGKFLEVTNFLANGDTVEELYSDLAEIVNAIPETPFVVGTKKS